MMNVIAGLGGGLRPTTNLDDHKRTMRGLFYLGGMTTVITLVVLSFAYYANNPGTKMVVVKGVDLGKTAELFEKADKGDISEMDCKCKR